MKKVIRIRLFVVLFFLVVHGQIFSQGTTPKSDLAEMFSENGEFSVRLPASYDAFFNKNGFTISNGFNSFELTNIYIINSYHDNSLLSFESYETVNPKMAVEILTASDKRLGTYRKLDAPPGFSIKEMSVKKKESLMIRRYIESATHIYVLTVGARDAETDAMRNFLDSQKLVKVEKGKTNPAIGPDSITLPKAKITGASIVVYKSPDDFVVPAPPPAGSVKTPDDPNIKRAECIFMGRAYFTAGARSSGEQGNVTLRITVTPNGGISKVEVKNELRGGLLGQAVFGALRTKCIPYEKAGVPTESKKLFSYSFSIY